MILSLKRTFIIFNLFLKLNFINSEWVKLPNISRDTSSSSTKYVRTSVLKSDVMSAVFKVASTTQRTAVLSKPDFKYEIPLTTDLKHIFFGFS
jgi:hypothetical protein